MKTLIRNSFFELNFIIFPIWIGVFYIVLRFFIPIDPKISFFIFFFIFGETHFASTYLFYLDKKNWNYIKKKANFLIYLPIILLIVYLVIGLIDLSLAILIGAAFSGYHVTQQSVGIQKIYAEKKNNFYIYLTYISSLLCLFFGFLRFYYPSAQNQFNLPQLNLNLDYCIALIIFFGVITLTEKTNYKKKLTNLTGVLIYFPYLIVENQYDAIVIGVGAHWCQYLAINYKIYFFREKVNNFKTFLFFFIIIYALLMATLGVGVFFDKNFFSLIVLVPLCNQFFHYYIDMFIWKFSDDHLKNVILRKLIN